MIRGVYTAASATLAQETAQSVIAGNLANVNTPGYKGDVATFKSFRLGALARTNGRGGEIPLGPMGAGASLAAVALDRTPGSIQTTGNPLDAALRDPNSFFVVRTPQGERLTRGGAFTLSPDGTLSDSGGFPVIGKSGGLIRVDTRAGAASLDANGNVVVNGQARGQLKIVALAPDAPDPVKEGGRLLRAEPASLTDVDRPLLLPGSLEMSNVSAITEMVGMITAMRAYEAAAKALQSEDEALGKALNEVARP